MRPRDAIAAILAAPCWKTQFILIHPCVAVNNDHRNCLACPLVAQNPAVYDHPTSSDAAKRLCHIPQAEPDDLVVIVAAWDDGWQRIVSSDIHSPNTFILMVLNFPRKIISRSQFTLSTCSKQSKLLVQRKLVDDFEAMERGPVLMRLAGDAEDAPLRRVWVRLLVNMGDDIAQRSAAGIMGTGSHHPCRYAKCHRFFFPRQGRDLNEIFREGLSVFALFERLDAAETPAQVKAAETALNNLGVNVNRSPFLKLAYWRTPLFYLHFVVDIMHLWDLGLARYTFQWTSKVCDKAQLAMMNNDLATACRQNLGHYSRLCSIGRLYNSDKRFLHSLTASQLHELVEHAESIFTCLRTTHPNLLELYRLSAILQRHLYRSSYTEQDLNDLSVAIFNWKAQMRAVFSLQSFNFQRPNYSISA